jgi:hypothetical protein
MGFFDRLKGQPEERGSVENPQVPISSSDFMRVMGWGDLISSSGITVGIDNALGVPAVWAAVNFMSGTLAGLTMEVYQRTPEGREKVTASADKPNPSDSCVMPSMRPCHLLSGANIPLTKCSLVGVPSLTLSATILAKL